MTQPMHTATEEETARVVDLMEAYLKETNSNITLEEMLFLTKMVLPIRDDSGQIVGFLGYDAVRSVVYGKIAVFKVLYMIPEVRRNFRNIMVMCFNFFKAQGYGHIESHVNKKINNWYRKRLGSNPEGYIHFGTTEGYLAALGGTE